MKLFKDSVYFENMAVSFIKCSHFMKQIFFLCQFKLFLKNCLNRICEPGAPGGAAATVSLPPVLAVGPHRQKKPPGCKAGWFDLLSYFSLGC